MAIGASSCQDNERNVILGKAPFYSHRWERFSEQDSDRVVDDVRAFAQEKGMDFLLWRESSHGGDFNVTAAGRDLNLAAMHIKDAGGGLDVLAYSREKPSQRDQQLLSEFVCKVARDCPNGAPVH